MIDEILELPKKRHNQIIKLLTILHKQLLEIEKEVKK